MSSGSQSVDPFHIDTLRMELSILYLKGVAGQNFYKVVYFFLWRLFFFFVFFFFFFFCILANSADPDEMPPNAAFHLGLHCLPKYLFAGIQSKKGDLLNHYRC